MNIVAIIPCYDVKSYCKPIIEETLHQVQFLVLIDDGSTDGTGEILRDLQQKNRDQIHLITFPHNQGKGAALLEGIKYALTSTPFEILVTLDSDGQHLPSEIPKLTALIKQGASFVIGARQFNQMPFGNRVANTVISFLLHRIYLNAPIDVQSGFRAFSKAFVQKMVKEVKGIRYEMEFCCILLALRDGDKIASCPIATVYLDRNRSSHFFKVHDSLRILQALFQHWRSL